MKTVKKNPNDIQIKQAKTTKFGSIEKSKSSEDKEIQDKKVKVCLLIRMKEQLTNHHLMQNQITCI